MLPRSFLFGKKWLKNIANKHSNVEQFKSTVLAKYLYTRCYWNIYPMRYNGNIILFASIATRINVANECTKMQQKIIEQPGRRIIRWNIASLRIRFKNEEKSSYPPRHRNYTPSIDVTKTSTVIEFPSGLQLSRATPYLYRSTTTINCTITLRINKTLHAYPDRNYTIL